MGLLINLTELVRGLRLKNIIRQLTGLNFGISIVQTARVERH